jgi:hypothetical protein
MEANEEIEYHPFLEYFTIMAIPGTLLLVCPFSSCGASLGSGNEVLEIIYFFVSRGLILTIPIWASIHTLQITKFFKHWNNGIKTRDKLIAYIAIYIGVSFAIALFFIGPFYRSINSLGESIGSSFIKE